MVGLGVGALVGWGVFALIHYVKHDSNCFGGCGAGARRQVPRRYVVQAPLRR